MSIHGWDVGHEWTNVPVTDVSGIAVKVQEGGCLLGIGLSDKPSMKGDIIFCNNVDIGVGHVEVCRIAFELARGYSWEVEDLLLECVQSSQKRTGDSATGDNDGLQNLHDW